VEGHAVYCHNSVWKEAPRKCQRSLYYGNKVGYEDSDCPEFSPNEISSKD
ncbi:hypothetical protein LCGC14_1955520, partial [marine sediment metagenome]